MTLYQEGLFRNSFPEELEEVGTAADGERREQVKPNGIERMCLLLCLLSCLKVDCLLSEVLPSSRGVLHGHSLRSRPETCVGTKSFSILSGTQRLGSS